MNKNILNARGMLYIQVALITVALCVHFLGGGLGGYPAIGLLLPLYVLVPFSFLESSSQPKRTPHLLALLMLNIGLLIAFVLRFTVFFWA
jgi:hypothetical protein